MVKSFYIYFPHTNNTKSKSIKTNKLAILFFTDVYKNMNIQPQANRPNFQANIKFVNSKEFEKHAFHSYFYCGKPKEPITDSFVKGDDIWTPYIRTCSAGGVVDNEGAVGFHIFDAEENIKAVKDKFADTIKNLVQNPKSALLIGSKRLDFRPDSIPLFETITDKIKKFVTPSTFKTHKHKFGESDIGYEKATDTWFIVTSKQEHPMLLNSIKEITTPEELKESFEQIKIAPQDRLFVMDKEITKSDYPEMFLQN